jgi:hypothetical protein
MTEKEREKRELEEGMRDRRTNLLLSVAELYHLSGVRMGDVAK